MGEINMAMVITDWKAVERKLTKDAQKFLQEAYGLTLECPVEVNGRLKSKNGRFVYSRRIKRPVKIEISKNYIQYQDWKIVIETLKHECIHYALYMLDKPFHDGHPLFEAEIQKHDSHSTGVIRYKGKVVTYECPSCKHEWRRKKKYPNNGAGYQCAKCKVQIVYTGEKIV